MSFAGVVTRQQAAVFRTLGEDAAWTGIAGPVRIRLAERDDLNGWGDGQAVVRVRFVRVRKTEVAAPVAGQIVTRALTGSPLLKVIGVPRLDRKGVWTCEVKEVAA